MKKAMTKRLLALVLALALCTSLMLPGFAATKPEGTAAPQESCSHNWIYLNAYPTTYTYYDATYHIAKTDIDMMCTICLVHKTEKLDSHAEGHNSTLYCTLCNHSIPHK